MTAPREPDEARRLGMEVLLQRSGDERDQVQSTSVDKLPQQFRERAINVAVRRLAFQLLYEIDMGAVSDPVPHVETALSQVDGLGPIAAQRVTHLVRGAFAQRATADEVFRVLAPEWPTHRQPGVDRALLRLAHFELHEGLTDPAIIINEAVELARRFSTEKSPAFINALLDKCRPAKQGQA
jgi:N utilization substance protein B